MVGGLGQVVGLAEAQPLEPGLKVLAVEVSYLPGSPLLAFGLGGQFVLAFVAVTDQMPDIGYIHHPPDCPAGHLKGPHQQIPAQKGIPVADMGVIINGWSASIDGDRVIIRQPGQFLAEAVAQLHHLS